MLNSFSTEDWNNLEVNLRTFKKDFINLFDKHKLTFYLHIVCDHLKYLLHTYGSLSIISQQAFEHFHAQYKRALRESTNNHESNMLEQIFKKKLRMFSIRYQVITEQNTQQILDQNKTVK